MGTYVLLPAPSAPPKSILQSGNHQPFWPWQTQQFMPGEELLAFSQAAPAAPTLLCWYPTPTHLERPWTWAVPRTCPFLPLHKCQNVWELGAGREGEMGRGQLKTSWLLAPIFPQVVATCVQKKIYHYKGIQICKKYGSWYVAKGQTCLHLFGIKVNFFSGYL